MTPLSDQVARAGASAEVDTRPARSKRMAGGLTLIVIGVGLIVVAMTELIRAIDTAGFADERVEWWRFVVGAVGAVVTAIGTEETLQRWETVHPSVRWTIAALIAAVTGLVIVLILLNRPTQEYEEGRLDAEHPFARRTILSGENGSSYLITLDTTPGLTATFSIRGAGQEVSGEKKGDRIVAEGVLAGSADTTWTVVIKLVEGKGTYLLTVDTIGPERIDQNTTALGRSLDPGRSNESYILDIPKRPDSSLGRIFIDADALQPGETQPGWILRSENGSTVDSVVSGIAADADELSRTTFTDIPPGTYTIELQGAVGQRFALTVRDQIPGDEQAVPTTPDPNTTIGIPQGVAYRAQGALVVNLLAGAGFVVQSIPVCSDRLSAANAEVGETRQIVFSGAATPADEVEVLGDPGPDDPGGTGLRVDALGDGSRLDVKTFNGLPCN